MNIHCELQKAWDKAQALPGKLEVIAPNKVSADVAAQTMIQLLQTTYANHAISREPSKVERAIHDGQVQPWIVTREGRPVASASLITQSDGSVELGRAVSIENGSGVGKIAMLSAASAARDPLVAEVRLADTFKEILSGEATQRICFGILELVPHAIVPAFAHGEPLRNEIFAFSAGKGVFQPRSITEAVQSTLVGRSMRGSLKRMQVVQSNPFQVAVPSDEGLELSEFKTHSRFGSPGCTMVALEVTDQNLATIAWLSENQFILAGLDRSLGPNNLPVILLATLAQGTLLAPTKVGNDLSGQSQRDIRNIAQQFEQVVGRG